MLRALLIPSNHHSEAKHFDISSLHTLLQVLAHGMVFLWSSTALQSIPQWAHAEKLGLGKRPWLLLAQGTGRFRACGLGMEHKYGELSGGKSSWPGIPLLGLEAWRGKWIILLRGAVPSCNVIGVSCAHHSSIGPAEGERLNLRAGSAKQYCSNNSTRQITDLA